MMAVGIIYNICSNRVPLCVRTTEPMDESSSVETSFSASQTPEAVQNHKDTFTVVVLANGDDRENTPLLESGSNDTEGAISLKKSKRRRWNWRSLILLTILWFVVLFIGAAYSMIAPFFPEQVIYYIHERA